MALNISYVAGIYIKCQVCIWNDVHEDTSWYKSYKTCLHEPGLIPTQENQV